MTTIQKNVFKTLFYKNCSENGGAQAEALRNTKPDELTIASQTTKHGRMWGISSPSNLLKLIEKNNGIYELISKFPHKVFFDIDKKDDRRINYLEDVKNIINEMFPDCDMAVSGSNTEAKESYHIILNNYLIHNENERIQLKMIVQHIKLNLDSAFDSVVYSKNRQFKCINQSKLDGRVQSIIENPDFKKHLITCFFNDFIKPLPKMNEAIEEEILIEKSKATFNLGSLPKMVLNTPKDIDFNTITSMEILSLLPLNPSFEFDYSHLVARFCFFNEITFDSYLSWLKNKIPNLVKNEDGQKLWDKLAKFPEVSIDKIKQILAFYYPQIKKDKSYRDFVQTFNIPKEIIHPIETMNQNCFTGNEKYSVFNIGMGGGKTAQTIDYLKHEPSFIWIAPNKALANNTQNRLLSKNIESIHYLTLSTKSKKLGEMNDIPRLISVLNSIHYLEEKLFNVVVIDEIETVLDKFYGDFMEQGTLQLKAKIWETFCSLIKNAKKVIFLDAFITIKTIDFINKLEGNLLETKVYTRLKEPQTREIVYMNNFEMTLHDIINKLKSSSKIFIFYPFKRDCGDIKSMEKVFNMIKAETGKDGIFYNADVDDKVKNGLKDVNESWGDLDFVLTNNIITCGINYENLDFDYKYLFIAPFNTPRDIIQVSYRARYLSSGIIKVCYMGKMNSVNTWLNDCKKIKCSVYSSLYENMMVEKKAPLKRAFQLFCVKAHYKQKVDDSEISKKIQKEINDLLEKQQLGMTYSSIDKIEKIEAERLQQLCLTQEASMIDKMTLQKYFYDKNFTDEGKTIYNDTGLNLVEVGWDSNYLFFFKQMKYVLLNPECVFNKIMTFNKMGSLFPNDIKKVKLNKEIIDTIFNEFSFKHITKTSSPYKILKEIYNVYFSKHIVGTSYEKGTNVIYYIEPSAHMFYDFSKAYLLLDIQANMTFNNNQTTELEEDMAIEI